MNNSEEEMNTRNAPGSTSTPLNLSTEQHGAEEITNLNATPPHSSKSSNAERDNHGGEVSIIQ